MKFHRRTNKLYYSDPYLSLCPASVVKHDRNWIELTDTVAYPEGGGQDADQGMIVLENGAALRFVDVKKMYGHAAGVSGFPDIQVDGIVLHRIHDDDLPLLPLLHPGARVTVSIDVGRRAALSLSHSASHLLYLAVGLHRPDAVADTLGCHIRIGTARFDFGVAHRFTSDELSKIQASANDFVRRNLTIELSAHADVPDARTWRCDGHAIPCGGTHIARTGVIGDLALRRKSLGVGKERISCIFPDAEIETFLYHS